MAYGSYRHIIHVARSGSNNDTYRLELQKKDFAGTSVEWLGVANDGVFKHHWDNLNPDELWEKPVQKSELELFPLIQNATDFGIIEEVFGSDEDEFRLVKKVNDTVVWVGKVLPGLMRWDEKAYPFPASIVAKDLSHLSGEDFPLEDNRETIITTIAKILPYDLPIHTYTSWVEANSTDSDDWLNQIYHDTIVIRTVDESSSLLNEPWTKYKALEAIAKAGRLIIRQDEGAWQIFQLSALTNPASVRRFVYNASGVQHSAGQVDLTKDVDQDVLHIMPSSVNENKEALKEVAVLFNHQSGSSEVVFPKIPGFVYPGGAVDMGELDYFLTSQPFTGNGDEYIEFAARVEQEVSSTSSQDLYYSITIGDYFLRPDTITGDLIWRNTFKQFIDPWIGLAPANINTTTGNLASASVFVPPNNFEFADGVPVRIERSTATNLPDGLEENTTYFIRDFSKDSNDFYNFKLTDTPGGDPIIPADAGDGLFDVFQVTVLVDLFKSAAVQTGNIIDVLTADIPDAAEGNLTVYLPAFAVGDFNAVYWFNTSLTIINPTKAGESIEYRLTQQGQYSLIEGRDDPTEIYFSDGPFPYSRSSYRHGSQINQITSRQGWNRRGVVSADTSHIRIWLREALDLRRTARRCLFAELQGSYSTNKVINYDGTHFFFLGGTQSGYENTISAELFEIRVETDV